MKLESVLRQVELRPAPPDLRLGRSCSSALACSYEARDTASSTTSSRMRMKLLRASTSWARAAASCARADCRPLSSFCGSSRAISWPGLTVSPMSTVRSTSRPSMRKDWLISVCACTVPVRATLPLSARFSIVTTLTGRISGGSASSVRRQAQSKLSTASARSAFARGRWPNRLAANFCDTERLPIDSSGDCMRPCANASGAFSIITTYCALSGA